MLAEHPEDTKDRFQEVMAEMLAEGHRDRQCKYENLNRLENVNMSL